MSKSLYIAEKPSVAQEFVKALKITGARRNGYLESEDAIVTWCVGHLITMSYPEKYDEKYKKWRLETLPFLPRQFQYEVIPAVKEQYETVSALLNRPDVDVIYVCTDSGREGEYIYRLVEQMAQVKGKTRKRVWIDSQTEEEILRGIREAKDLSEYDNLSASAYLRAKEDYLMGINFSRLLSLKYAGSICNYLHSDYQAVSVGRVMTCVLGMAVRREREIREFVKTPFYRVLADFRLPAGHFEAEWRAVEGSRHYQSPKLYRENGWKKKEEAQKLIDDLLQAPSAEGVVEKAERKKEKKYPPLLFNLAELQNVCAKLFKISPDETLRTAQELYEKKLITYPRTDARVLSSAAAKEIGRNLSGLCHYEICADIAAGILKDGAYASIGKSRYVNDKKITDHYALIPTGQGLGQLSRLKEISRNIYEIIVRRFLSVFYPPAVYQKVNLELKIKGESFFAGFKVLAESGYLDVAKASFARKRKEEAMQKEDACDAQLLQALKGLRKGTRLPIEKLFIKEGETAPPKRYNSGTMILAMENAGQLIEDEELRAQIKGSGIGTSATRAEILKKLFNIKYLDLNKKTQVVTPTLFGEMVYDVVNHSIRSLLNPELTASWEKGLTYVAQGQITVEEYMEKLETFIRRHTQAVMNLNNQCALRSLYDAAAKNYKGVK